MDRSRRSDKLATLGVNLPPEPAQSWRLIPPFLASGAFHMALDAWLLRHHAAGTHPPTLRFYTWEPVAISLGYHQRTIPDHWQHLTWQEKPIEIVQRPTGGRAVLHQGDLTYAVVMSGLPLARRAAYEQICEFLIQGWRSLGVDLSYGQAGRSYIHNPNCFGLSTTADLVLPDGSKLIGSAQRRSADTVLQHGSIRLSPAADLFQAVFNADPQLPQLPLKLDKRALLGTVIAALTKQAQTCFNAKFQVRPLSKKEWQQVESYEFSKPWQS